MPIMLWDDSLDIGVAEMNREHQGLLDLMNALYDASQAGKTGPEVLDLLKKLETATVEHFRDEEAYMDKIGFPGAPGHKLIHKDLLEKFGTHASAIRASHGQVNEDFFKFLRFWLSAHIRGIDIKYGQMSRAKAS